MAKNRRVKWGKPTVQGSRKVRVSKCGRFRIVTMAMASGRAGYFNARAYESTLANGKRIGRHLHDTLEGALDAVEWENDPNWEPEDS